jgi:hypothetical protein
VRRAAPAVLALVLAAGCGGESGDDRPEKDPFVAVGERHARPQAPHAVPRWERIGTFSGSGEAVERIEVRRDALQWRVRWTCERGRIALTAGRDGARPERLAAERCPGEGRTSSLQHGRLALRVRAGGPWRLVVEQQIDAPIHEPPLREMSAPGARRIAAGAFYGIERKGSGRVALHRLPGGRLALRLEEFATTTNTDLVVWLSATRRPRTSREAFRAPYTQVAPLKSTMGEQNYVVPRGVPRAHLRSVVIWCVPERIAYAAARLRPR